MFFKLAPWVACVMFASSAQAVNLRFDCFLQNTNVSCNDIQSALLGSVAFLKSDEGGIAITIRSSPIDAGTRYDLHFKGQQNQPEFTLQDRIPNGLDSNATLLRIVGDLHRGLAPYLSLKKVESGGNNLVLDVVDPESQNLSEAREDKGASPFYFRPSVSLRFSKDSFEQLQVRSFATLNYSTPKWRLRNVGFGGYERITDEADGEVSVFEQTFLGGFGGAIYSLHEGLSIAARYLVAHDSADNQLYTIRPAFGVEWVLHPFLENNSSNFGVQYRIGGEHVVFIEKNIRDNDLENFLFHQAKAFASWHWSRIDLELAGEFRSILDDLDFSSVGTNGSLAYRITDDLRVSLDGRASYRNNLINAPKDESDDALEQIFGGNFSDVTYRVDLSLSYTFGNALLDRQDRRWAQ